MGDYMSEQQIARRRASRTQDQKYDSGYFDFISFQEEQIVTGPPVELLNNRFKTFSYYHVEIFQALAGKRQALYQQRKMENVFLEEIGRQDNLIFTKVLGGEADCFTIGFYRDIKHYAEGSGVSAEAENEAAKKAGFEGANTIGSYLRTLLLEHHDTLANAVRAD